MRRKKLKIKFEECKELDVPIIRLKLEGGKEVFAIIDTGSEITLIDREKIADTTFLFTLTSNDEQFEVNGLNSRDAIQKQFVETYFEYGGKLFFLVGTPFDFRNINENTKGKVEREVWFIIGGDVLKAWNADVNYKKRELTIEYEDRG